MTSVHDDVIDPLAGVPETSATVSSGDGPLGRLAALVLLAGSVRANHWGAALGRSVLDLPVTAGQSILGQWYDQAEGLAEALSCPVLPMRVLLDHLALVPELPQQSERVPLRLERDRFDFRGSGGVLFDAAVDYEDDEYLLIGNAASIVSEPLADLARALAAADADISIHSLPDATPSGLMLVRCGSLREIATLGFIDMKEQALPEIAKKHDVSVVRRKAECRAIRSFKDYLEALRAEHRRRQGEEVDLPYAEDWQSRYTIIEDAALVEAGACVHDSVVLRDGRVEAGAVVVRSVVCAGGVVKRGETIVDRVVAPLAARR